MSLHSYLTKKVILLTTDGRTLLGTLESFDQSTNLVLSGTIERIIRPASDDEESSEIAHGLYVVRGDNVLIMGEVDLELDDSINWKKVKGEGWRNIFNA